MIKNFFASESTKHRQITITTPQLFFYGFFLCFHFALLGLKNVKYTRKNYVRFRIKKHAREKQKKTLYYTLENHLLPHKLHVFFNPTPQHKAGGREVFLALRKRKTHVFFFCFFFDSSNMKKYCSSI